MWTRSQDYTIAVLSSDRMVPCRAPERGKQSWTHCRVGYGRCGQLRRWLIFIKTCPHRRNISTMVKSGDICCYRDLKVHISYGCMRLWSRFVLLQMYTCAESQIYSHGICECRWQIYLCDRIWEPSQVVSLWTCKFDYVEVMILVRICRGARLEGSPQA